MDSPPMDRTPAPMPAPMPDRPPARVQEDAVALLARRIGGRAIGTGGVARLRRLDPMAPAAPEFWRLLAEIAEGAGHAGVAAEGTERGWAMVMAGMARMAPNHHRRGAAFAPGRVLAATDYAEPRLLRLLRVDPGTPAFADALRAVAAWLAVRGQPVDWTGLAALALARHEDAVETARRSIARDYYTAADHAVREDAATP